MYTLNMLLSKQQVKEKNKQINKYLDIRAGGVA
jgi:hypothetical protein